MKTLKLLGKITGAGILAVIILSVLMCFYSIRITRISNENGNTDYIYPAGSVWVKATEGISYGKMDSNGFNNITVFEEPDIIVVGSSNKEAFDVMRLTHSKAVKVT